MGVNANETDDSASSSGAAYVFVRQNGIWSQQAYLKASNTDESDRFGGAVAISEDTVVVGSRREASNASGLGGDQSNNAALSSGAAYVFVRQNGIWSQQAYLKASNAEPNDNFGDVVAVSADTVVVGARNESSGATGANGNQSDNSVLLSGAVYVFVRLNGTWSQQAYLKASNTEQADFFGTSAAISGDVVVVGAPNNDGAGRGLNGDRSGGLRNTGAAYVFVRQDGIWSQRVYLKASHPTVEGNFGFDVGVSGELIAVGTIGDASNAVGINGDPTDTSAADSGAVYTFAPSL